MDATPKLSDVLDAIEDEMNSMSPLPGTVIHYENYLDDEEELVEKFQDGTTGALTLWLMTGSEAPEIEDGATGERYTQYAIRLRLLHIIVGDPAWSRHALAVAERVRSHLVGNQNVFAIGGQRQLRTQETVTLASCQKKTIGLNQNEVYEAVLILTVEGRRFA